MKHISKYHNFYALSFSTFSHILFRGHFRHMVSYIILPNLKLIQIFLARWLFSSLNDIYSFVIMLTKPRFRIYIFTLVGALVGIGQCKWMNTVIMAGTTSVFFVTLKAIKYSTKAVWVNLLKHFFTNLSSSGDRVISVGKKINSSS